MVSLGLLYNETKEQQDYNGKHTYKHKDTFTVTKLGGRSLSESDEMFIASSAVDYSVQKKITLVNFRL